MKKSDPRRRKFWQTLIWFIVTMVVLVILLRFLRSPAVLVALWGVGLIWGGVLAYKLSQLFFGVDPLVVSDERSQVYLEQVLDYKTKIDKAIKSTSRPTSHVDMQQLSQQVDYLTGSIEDLANRISNLRHNEVIRRDLQMVPKAIEDLENRLASEEDQAIRAQLERTLINRKRQLESLEELQNTIKRAEIQIESTLSQLGTIYSHLLTGQSTSQVADYSRLAADVDEEVCLLEDHLEALREVKLGAADGAGGVCYASIAGVPPLSSPRQTPGMKPPEQGFIGEE